MGNRVSTRCGPRFWADIALIVGSLLALLCHFIGIQRSYVSRGGQVRVQSFSQPTHRYLGGWV